MGHIINEFILQHLGFGVYAQEEMWLKKNVNNENWLIDLVIYLFRYYSLHLQQLKKKQKISRLLRATKLWKMFRVLRQNSAQPKNYL